MKLTRFLPIALSLLLILGGCTPKEPPPEPVPERDSATEEILTLTTFDGLSFDGKLRMPAGGAIDKLVIYVNGSGPTTYDNHRKMGNIAFNYFDLFAEQFGQRGIAFFSYNTRGVTPGEEPPYFADIDYEGAYQTYIPSNEVQDLETIITTLKGMPALRDAKVILLGWSAGAMVGPATALRGNVQIDALFLAGYPNGTMEETLIWQQEGHAAMTVYRQYYDYDKSGDITREELMADKNGVSANLGGNFDDFDVNGDGVITAEDFGMMMADTRKAVLAAFDEGDDMWLRYNYGVLLTSAWYQDYKNLPPNRETLLKLDLPIHIFHGEYDANVSVEGVRDIESAFASAGKANLTVYIFDDHDHDLNYSHYPYAGIISAGFNAIFDEAEKI